MSLNVDQDEINKFADLATRWWDKNSEFKPLHDINPLRVEYIKQKCGGSLQGKKVLDIGCGGGILSEALALEGAQVTAIDKAGPGLEVAKLHLLESGLDINYRNSTAEEFSEQSKSKFDVICCLEMLEHVPSPSSVINACSDLVKKNGDVFFSTINRNIKSYLFAIIGAEYILNLLPKGTHDWNKFIEPAELNDWAESANLAIKDITGMTYNPITKIYMLEQDTAVNYICHYQK